MPPPRKKYYFHPLVPLLLHLLQHNTKTLIIKYLLRNDIIEIMKFNLKSNYSPAGDQPEAIEQLVDGIGRSVKIRCFWGDRLR